MNLSYDAVHIQRYNFMTSVSNTFDIDQIQYDKAIVTYMNQGSHGYITLAELQTKDVYIFNQHKVPQNHRDATKWVIMYEGSYAVLADIMISTESTTGFAKCVIVTRKLVLKSELGAIRSTRKNQYIADIVGARLLN